MEGQGAASDHANLMDDLLSLELPSEKKVAVHKGTATR